VRLLDALSRRRGSWWVARGARKRAGGATARRLLFYAKDPATFPPDLRVVNRRYGNDQSHGKKHKT
jgi:hypothetical protein